jgi:hypothetical protein
MNLVTLIHLLRDNKGSMISLVSKTKPTLLRKDKQGTPCPYSEGEVVHVCFQTVNPMANYEAAVQRQQERKGIDGDFKASTRRNGTVPLNGWPLAVHSNGNIYLRVTNPQVIRSQYFINGNPVDVSVILPFLPSKNNKRQEEAGLEGKAQIKYRDISLSHIRRISLKGRTINR